MSRSARAVLACAAFGLISPSPVFVVGENSVEVKDPKGAKEKWDLLDDEEGEPVLNKDGSVHCEWLHGMTKGRVQCDTSYRMDCPSFRGVNGNNRCEIQQWCSVLFLEIGAGILFFERR